MKKYYLISLSVVVIFILAFSFVGLIFSFLYPLKYKNEIKAYAKQYGLAPEFVAGVINVESGFNKNATSNAGAMGLMQLMPNTAIEIAANLNYDDFKITDLYNPAINIEFGCYYLSYLNYIFPNNINNVLAGYNAGLTNVNYWLLNETYSSDGIVLITTPYQETNNFIVKVKRNQTIYAKKF